MGDLCILFFLGLLGWGIYTACSAGAAVATAVAEHTPEVLAAMAAEATRQAEEAARLAAEEALIDAAADTTEGLLNYFFGK